MLIPINENQEMDISPEVNETAVSSAVEQCGLSRAAEFQSKVERLLEVSSHINIYLYSYLTTLLF